MSPPALPPQAEPCTPCRLGLASAEHSTSSKQPPARMEGAEQPQGLVWDTGAKEVSKGEGRKSSLLLELEWLGTEAINKRKCVGCFVLFVCKL